MALKFTTRLAGQPLRQVWAAGQDVYACGPNGFYISTDYGNTFVRRTTADGLGDNSCYSFYVRYDRHISTAAATYGQSVNKSRIYVATKFGLNGGNTDNGTNFGPGGYTVKDGLPDNCVLGVIGAGTATLLATLKGICMSTGDLGLQPFVRIANAATNSAMGASYDIDRSDYIDDYGENKPCSGSTWLFVDPIQVNALCVAASSGLFISLNGGGDPGKTTNWWASYGMKEGLADTSAVAAMIVPGNGGSTGQPGGSVKSPATYYAATKRGLSISQYYRPTAPNGNAAPPAGVNSKYNMWFKTITDRGMPNNSLQAVYVYGKDIYVGHQALSPTVGGLSVSSNNGTSFTNYNVANSGLASNDVRWIHAPTVASGSTPKFYVATSNGLSISV